MRRMLRMRVSPAIRYGQRDFKFPGLLFNYFYSITGFMTRMLNIAEPNPSQHLLSKVQGPYSTILADPPWQFQNRTGKVAPEHKRLLRYPTMELKEIMELPVSKLAAAKSHLYLWVPNALLQEGLKVMEAWGFTYTIWYGTRCGRMAGQMEGEWGSISVTLRNWCCSACAAACGPCSRAGRR